MEADDGRSEVLVDVKVIQDTLALGAAAGQVALDVRTRIKAAHADGSDGGGKVTLLEAEAIVEEELKTLRAPVLALVRDLVG